MQSSVSYQYAKALFDLSGDDYLNRLKQLEDISILIKGNSEFESFLQHPKISNHEKKVVFTESFIGLEDLIMDFIFVLIDNKRINILDAIIKSFIDIYNQMFNIMEFEITSATPLLKEEISEIKEKLRIIYNKNIVIKENINPNYIGGLVIKHNDKVIDDTILTRVINIRDYLKNRKLR